MKHPPAGVIPFRPLLHTTLHRRLRVNGSDQAMAQPVPVVLSTGNHG